MVFLPQHFIALLWFPFIGFPCDEFGFGSMLELTGWFSMVPFLRFIFWLWCTSTLFIHHVRTINMPFFFKLNTNFVLFFSLSNINVDTLYFGTMSEYRRRMLHAVQTTCLWQHISWPWSDCHQHQKNQWWSSFCLALLSFAWLCLAGLEWKMWIRFTPTDAHASPLQPISALLCSKFIVIDT